MREKTDSRRMDRRRIVFLAVNASYSHSSLASWCLRSCVDREVWEWRSVETAIHDDPAAVRDRILAVKPDVVAATLYLFTRTYTMGILRWVKEALPDCAVIVGGPECLGDNRGLFTPGAGVDAAVRGEGEIAFRQWLEVADEPERWTAIPGLCTLREGEYVDGGVAAAIGSLDEIPAFYKESLSGVAKPFVQIETSRGCSNGCLFCTSRQTRLRFKSLDRVRRDLAAIRAAGIPEVRVVDRTFNEAEGRALELIRVFRDEFPQLRFHLEIDPARVSGKLAVELGIAPHRFHIEAGVQSLGQAVHAAIERSSTPHRALTGLRRLCAIQGLDTHVDLIAGLPGAGLAQVREDIRAVMAVRPCEIQLERLKLLPGTPLALTPERWGLVAAAEPPYQVLHTPEISADELRRVDRWSRLLDWYYNVPSLQSIVASAVLDDAGFIERFEEWIWSRGGCEICPSLEARFRMLDEYLSARASSLIHPLRYLWFRMGFSARSGLAPAMPWKKGVPAGAELVEGAADAVVARVWRIDLDRTYFFCYGTGANKARAVVAIYGLAR